MREVTILNSDKYAIVDDEDYDKLCNLKWYFHSGRVYYQLLTPREGRRAKRQLISMASAVMNNPAQMYDHKDRNPLNNQKDNLREASFSENGHNRTKLIGTSSKYIGVSWYKNRQKWHAEIKVNGRRHYLGSFVNEVEAAKAYNDAAIKYFKEFANLNTIQ